MFRSRIGMQKDIFPEKFIKLDQEMAEKIEGATKENNNIEENHTVE